MPERHRWVRLREHVYICKKCGCGKVNEERRRGEWVTWFHAADGTTTARGTPECCVGERSQIYLDKYRAVIESGGVPK